MKDLADQNGRLDGVICIHKWSSTCASFARVPPIYRFLGKPDRDVSAPTQCVVVFGPVGDPVFGLGKLVAKALVMFEGHWVCLDVKSTRIMPVSEMVREI